MKRIAAWLLSLTLLASAAVGLIPVAAEGADASENSVADLVWDKTVGTPAVTKTETGAVMSGLANSWILQGRTSSPP